MLRRAKWHEAPEEIKEEDDHLTGEELKLFQNVAARFNFLAMDRPDLLHAVTELMRRLPTKVWPAIPSSVQERHVDIHGLSWTVILKCLATQTLLDVSPRDNSQLEESRL